MAEGGVALQDALFGDAVDAPPRVEQPDACAVAFTVPGAPVPKGRARSRIVKTRDGRQFVSHYTPDETTQYENLIRMCAKDAMHDRYPLDGPIRLDVTVVIPIPASWSQRKQRDAVAGRVGAKEEAGRGQLRQGTGRRVQRCGVDRRRAGGRARRAQAVRRAAAD